MDTEDIVSCKRVLLANLDMSVGCVSIQPLRHPPTLITRGAAGSGTVLQAKCHHRVCTQSQCDTRPLHCVVTTCYNISEWVTLWLESLTSNTILARISTHHQDRKTKVYLRTFYTVCTCTWYMVWNFHGFTPTHALHVTRFFL